MSDDKPCEHQWFTHARTGFTYCAFCGEQRAGGALRKPWPCPEPGAFDAAIEELSPALPLTLAETAPPDGNGRYGNGRYGYEPFYECHRCHEVTEHIDALVCPCCAAWMPLPGVPHLGSLRLAYDAMLRARREQDEEAAKLAHRCQALEAQLAAALADAARANAQAGCSAEALRHNTAFTIKRLETDLARAERRQSDAMADGRLGWATAGALTFEISRLGTMTTELREQVAEATECFDTIFARLQECRADLSAARGEPPPKLWDNTIAQTTDPKAPGYIVD